jgi:hypothetical protein
MEPHAQANKPTISRRRSGVFSAPHTEGNTMQQLTLQQTAAYLEHATIEHTHDVGHALVHIGRSAFGVAFVLVNNTQGETVLTESM